MQKLILLDGNSLLNRAYYALPNLCNSKGQFTGAVYGCLGMLLKIIEIYRPTHIVATFDRKAPTFRKEMYAQYKATRKAMPDELASQLAPVKRALKVMGIPVVEMDGFEADDLIGTLAKRFDVDTYIVTGDKDSLQLIDDTTTVLLTKKGISEIKVYDETALAEEGLKPSQVIDLKSLMGDSSDNIPGVHGVGEKTARALLASYGTLDGVYEHIDEIKGKLREKLLEGKELAYLSYKLATIDTHCDIELELDEALLPSEFSPELRDILTELEFTKMIPRFKIRDDGAAVQEACPVQVTTIYDVTAFNTLLAAVREAGVMAIELGSEAHISFSPDESRLVELADDLLGEGIPFDSFARIISPVLADESIVKICYDAKALMHKFDYYDIKLVNFEDVMLKAYLIDANRNFKDFADMRAAYGEEGTDTAAALVRLNAVLDAKLDELQMHKLYRELELPLVEVLYKMERVGFGVDRQVLDGLDAKFALEIDELKKTVYGMAGEEFNINSTKQLAEVLFDKLGLSGGKKNKTGLSTNAAVLNSLKDAHPIVPEILRYREISKLKSTYLDGMRPLIDDNGRIHTVFKQAVTSTGRLSSTEPNLQNIPIRRPEGKKIRAMFIPTRGNVLVTADYSQIELRLMAAFSGDENMVGAFRRGEDIHTSTAAQIFGLSPENVDANLRRQAKAVNFGIIYGISDFGLSEDLNIPVWSAREFIEKYFATYPDVKRYMEHCKETAKECGFAETMFGRRRAIPELKSSNYNTRSFGERVAMNMPLQGSASDIIKMAMIAVDKRLEGREAKLIMQVHDELIVDCPARDAEEIGALLKECMENVAELPVKLVADVGTGTDWLEAK